MGKENKLSANEKILRQSGTDCEDKDEKKKKRGK